LAEGIVSGRQPLINSLVKSKLKALSCTNSLKTAQTCSVSPLTGMERTQKKEAFFFYSELFNISGT